MLAEVKSEQVSRAADISQLRNADLGTRRRLSLGRTDPLISAIQHPFTMQAGRCIPSHAIDYQGYGYTLVYIVLIPVRSFHHRRERTTTRVSERRTKEVLRQIVRFPFSEGAMAMRRRL